MTTNQIKINCSGVVVSSAIVAALSLIAWFKSSPSFKSLSATLFFSSAGIGAVTKLKSVTDQHDINDQLELIIESVDNEKAALSKQLKAAINENREQQLIALALHDKLVLSTDELELLKSDYTTVKAKLQLTHEELHLKSQELKNHESTVDRRFQNFLKEFIDKVVNTLYEKIEQTYNSLDSNCLQLLGREEYGAIHKELAKFQVLLETNHDGHISLVRDLEQFDYNSIHSLVDANIAATEVIDRYNQLTDEMLALKNKYRNLKTLDERRALQEYQQCEEYKTTKANAIQTLREQTNLDKSVIDRLQSGLKANTHGLSELITGIGSDLEKANERVAQLSAPIIWKIAPNQASKAGNTIIAWCKSKGIHLDRSHYTGDKYDADLFFFTDRLNAAQVIDLKALNEEGESLAQLTHCLEPVKFTYDYDSRLIIAHIVMLRREKATKSVKDFLQSPDKLLQFVRDSYHVGLWGSTGQGKTTAIANIVGGMIQELGGTPVIRTTIPKIDDDSRNIFPSINWLGVKNSIFGLLESSLEIQYRIHSNEQAYINSKPFPEFEPILFFIDEINLIFTRWKRVSEGDLEDVLARFEATLKDDRLAYFNQCMRIELENYKSEFAKKLLLFTWQTGRSLKVKSLIAGQNLQPGAFGIMKGDLDNCAYLALGKSAKTCIKYKVGEFELEKVNQQYELIQKEIESQPELKFTGLYCPSQGKSFFGQLPPPNHHKWDKDLLISRKQSRVIASYQEEEAQTSTGKELYTVEANLDILDNGLDEKSKDVQNSPQPEALQQESFKAFGQTSKLPRKFQKLSNEGFVQLWQQLPRKADGTPHKTQAYESVFGVKRSDDRRVVSDFIDWLEITFK